MTLKTVPVTGTLYNPDGSLASGVTVTATLTVADTDNGIVVPNPVPVTSDASGVFTINLWPNSRGVSGSQYRVKAQMPNALDGVLLAQFLITVPDSDPAVPVPIETITNRRGPDALSDAKAAMLAAQAAALQAQQALASAIAVAGDQANVDAVAAALTNLNALATDLANLNALAGDKANLDALAGMISTLNAIAADLTNINAVATDQTNVDAVATALASVNTCAQNITAIQNAQANANAAANSATQAAASAGTAQQAASQAAGALASARVFATTAKALSNGVLSTANLVAGTGGTNGTFALGFSGGGGSGAAGYFVVANGGVSQIVLTNPGDSYTSAPTISFAASAGLTGASATAVIGTNVASQSYFATPSSTQGGYFDLYINNGGTPQYQNTYPSLQAINAYIDSVTKGGYFFGQKTSTFPLGTSANPVTGTAIAGNTNVWAAPVPHDGIVSQFQFWATGNGTVKLKRFNSSYVEVANSGALACVAGLNTYATDKLGTFNVSAGDHLGFYSTVGVYVSGQDLRATYYNGGAGDLTNPAHTTIQTSLVLQAQAIVSYPITNASNEQANNAIVSRFRDEAKVTHRMGRQEDTYADGNSAQATGFTTFMDPTFRSGRISKFRAYMGAQDYVQLWRWTRSGDTITRDSDPLDIFLMPAGYSEVALDIAVEAGVYLSVQSAHFRLDTTTRFPGRGWIGISASATTFAFDGSHISNVSSVPQLTLEVDYNSYVGQVQKHRVSLGRTDAITLIGNSYGAGAYHPRKKTWWAQLSAMLGWNLHNYSVSANTLENRNSDIEQGKATFWSSSDDGNAYGTNTYGASYRDYRTTYALILLATNEASSTALMNGLHDTLETVRSSGAIPILVTELTNVWLHAAIYRQAAQKYGAIFIDLSNQLTKFPQTYAGFDRAGHKAMRVASALYAATLARAIENVIGQPRSAIKLYRPRPGVAYTVANDLIYETGDDLRHSLNSKWQEVEIGGGSVLSGDANIGYMDAISTTASYTTTAQTYSEYLQAERGHPLSFTDFALLSAMLDAQPQNAREARIYVGTGHDAVYARTVYTSGSYPSAGSLVGYWSALPVTSDGWAIVREWEMSGKLSGNGRMDILVQHAGAFTLQNPKVEWWGESNRTRVITGALSRPKGAEAITNPAPYNAGVLASGWTSTGAPTLTNTANGGDLPKNTTGYVRLTSADTVSVPATFTADAYDGREVEISVWASGERALVNGTTYPTGASMTGDSWDGEQLTVENVNGSNSAKSALTLMPYWQEVKVRTWLAAGDTTVTVRLGCATSGAVLVAKASCKLVDG